MKDPLAQAYLRGDEEPPPAIKQQNKEAADRLVAKIKKKTLQKKS